MELLIIFVVGVLVGGVCITIMTRIKSVGSIRVDTSDPNDSPYLFLELSKDIDVLYRKRHIMLKVNTVNLIPPKNLIPHE